jgi:stage II sporulation protein AA (anti-sigma F factor antagonist)
MSGESQQRWLDICQQGAVTVVRLLCPNLTCEIDVSAVGKRLLRVVEELGGRRIVLNLIEVERMDSLMIGKIIALYKTARAAGGRVVLCALNPLLAEALEALHINRLLAVYATEQEAVEALASAP